jgi:hypothetical protein
MNLAILLQVNFRPDNLEPRYCISQAGSKNHCRPSSGPIGRCCRFIVRSQAGNSGAVRDRPIRFCFELAFAWLAIAALIALGVYADNLAVTLICIFLISTRQMVLALLLHGQVHRLGLRSKYGDWLVNVLAVYPLFVTSVESYAKAHLSHHKYFFTGGFRFSPLCN